MASVSAYPRMAASGVFNSCETSASSWRRMRSATSIARVRASRSPAIWLNALASAATSSPPASGARADRSPSPIDWATCSSSRRRRWAGRKIASDATAEPTTSRITPMTACVGANSRRNIAVRGLRPATKTTPTWSPPTWMGARSPGGPSRPPPIRPPPKGRIPLPGGCVPAGGASPGAGGPCPRRSGGLPGQRRKPSGGGNSWFRTARPSSSTTMSGCVRLP